MAMTVTVPMIMIMPALTAVVRRSVMRSEIPMRPVMRTGMKIQVRAILIVVTVVVLALAGGLHVSLPYALLGSGS